MKITDVIILCPGCGVLKPAALYGVYIANTGQQYPHCLCRSCAEIAAASSEGHDLVSAAVELHFHREGTA